MGTACADSEERDLHEVVIGLLAKAGIEAVLPAGLDGLCCGMPFASKGLVDAADRALRRTEAALWQASDEGRLTVLCDTSPCTARLGEHLARPLQVVEPIRFVRETVLPRLARVRQVPAVAVHVTCSARKMGLAEDLMALAHACAERVFIPEEDGCCGFAGDRGFTVPELNASALARLREQLPADCAEGVSNSRTCEIGLSRHSGIPYRSIVYLVDRCFDGPA
jgi:D-lactate dehydrogenase